MNDWLLIVVLIAAPGPPLDAGKPVSRPPQIILQSVAERQCYTAYALLHRPGVIEARCVGPRGSIAEVVPEGK